MVEKHIKSRLPSSPFHPFSEGNNEKDVKQITGINLAIFYPTVELHKPLYKPYTLMLYYIYIHTDIKCGQ